MVLAELEAWYSRPIAPTRRVALGDSVLPASPPPGFGGVLLGGVVARFAPDLDPDMTEDLHQLLRELELGRRIPQPRLRHRLQRDRIGLQRCRHRLVGEGEEVAFHFDVERGTAAQHVLAAAYAAGELPPASRHAVMAIVRRALAWRGPVDGTLVAHLTGTGLVTSVAGVADPRGWAMSVLSLPADTAPRRPSRVDVQRAFREALRDAHPDHGAEAEGAAARIAELNEARRILLG